MERSEQLTAIFGAVLCVVPLSFIGWRTLTLPHDSPFWPLLIPLGLFVLLAIITPIARGSTSGVPTIIQNLVYFVALAAGLGAVGTTVVYFWNLAQGRVEEPGLLLIMFTAAFVPACAYVFAVLSVDQQKLLGRI